MNEKGEAQAVSIPEGGFPMDIMKGCAYHSLEEYHNLAEILPGLYEQYRNRPDRLKDYRK